MRFIINHKVYDTEKMMLIANVKKWYEMTDMVTVLVFGAGRGKYFECQVYRSPKGNYLLVHKHSDGNIHGEAISETEAKERILKFDYESYIKLFGDGEVEEA